MKKREKESLTQSIGVFQWFERERERERERRTDRKKAAKRNNTEN